MADQSFTTKVETGTLLRLDSTVTATMIHEPSDSWRGHGAPFDVGDLPGAALPGIDHSRRASACPGH